MQKIRLPLIILLLGIVGFFGFVQPQKSHVPETEVHYHAGFEVYVDGVKQDFSDFRYMNFTPCSEHQEKLTSAEEQMEKAHLHDGVGDVVHVHRNGATWADLFKNIGYAFPTGKTVVAYENGQQVNDILTKPITAYQSIIIIVGDQKGVDLDHPVTLDHIKDIEGKSELCGTNK